MSACDQGNEAGVYVLGALSPEDRVAFEKHLAGCEECARSVRELAGLPGLLARVPVEMVDSDEQPLPVPDTLLPSLVYRARRTQRRRTWAIAGLAAAVVAIGGVTIGTTLGHDDALPSATQTTGPRTVAPEPFISVGAQPISGWLSLTPVGWGTRLDLACAYSEGGNAYGSAETYTMFVTRTDGTSEQVASWKALPGKTMRLSAATSASRADIARVEVRAANGNNVLRLEPVSG